MSVARTARRRRAQAANGFKHLPPRKRPNYKMRDLATSARHEARLRETAQRIRQGSKK